jgi:uncharacterized protein (TIGR03546 family)
VIVLKLLVRLVRLLNSETSSPAIAAAFALGMVLGLAPFLTLQAWLALVVILFLRVNLTAALFATAACKLIALGLTGPFDRLGVSLLEAPSLAGLWTWLYNSPLSICNTHHSTTLGATVEALALAAPLFFAVRILVDLYRSRFSEWWSALGIVAAFRGSKLYRLYLWLDSPFQSP